jgi:hypothetical protein
MTQKELVKNVENKLKSISTRLESYKKVDATLSEETLETVLEYLETAEDILESGFVNDACEEIENNIILN